MRRSTPAVVLLLLAGACTSQSTATLPPITATTSTPTAPLATTPATTTDAGTEAPRPTVPESAEHRRRRAEMVVFQIDARGVEDSLVLTAMGSVPRHEFVTDEYLDYAYADGALPIGYGQTISQPYIVALMSEALDVNPGDRVLEIGTGSGYQAAVLAAMGAEVYTIEIIPELAASATSTLSELGYSVVARNADGYFGWPEAAPFDGIIVTAAPDHVPQPLVDQLAPGGVLVIPVGPIGAVQTLWRFTIGSDGELAGLNLGPVRFVPFTRDEE